MATRITRKELKTDKFALEVGHTVDYVGEHKREIARYALIALAVVIAAAGIYFYRGHQQTLRQEALAKAIQIQEAPAGGALPGVTLSFPTQEAKDKEAVKAFTEIASKYSGSDEGLIARYYLACIAADQGKLAEAEKGYKEVAQSSNKRYASIAKLALGQIYFLDGHAAEGEKILRSLIDNPTIFVSKEQATIALARAIAKTNPNEARKLLEPLRTGRSSVSQTAIMAIAEMGQ